MKPQELIDIIVEAIGLVPKGANKREYIVTKGGDHPVPEIADLAKSITDTPEFWQRIAKALTEGGEDDARAAVAMAVKIIGTRLDQLPDDVKDAVAELTDFVESSEAPVEDEEVEENVEEDVEEEVEVEEEAPEEVLDEEEETPVDVLDEVDEEEEDEEEDMAGQPGELTQQELASLLAEFADVEVAIAMDALDSLMEKGGDEEEMTKDKDREEEEDMNEEVFSLTDLDNLDVPEEFAQVVGVMRQHMETMGKELASTKAQLETAEREKRKEIFRQRAENYAALPEVEPESFADTLMQLEEANPEAYKVLEPILEMSAEAFNVLYKETGTQRAPNGAGDPFEQRIETKARELQKEHPDWSYEKAYTEAFTMVGSEDRAGAELYVRKQQHKSK